MGRFSKYPRILYLPPDFKLLRIEEDFEYITEGDMVAVPEGFVCDGASIPQWAWSLIGGRWGRYGFGAVVHDFSYFAKLFSRKRCDVIFLEAMKDLGVAWWKRKIMYRCVRLFAWWGWNTHRRRNED